MTGARSSASHIFVVGAARSGTTLTATILGRHPRVLSLGETHFYEDVWPRGRGPTAWDRPGEAAGLAERTLSLFGRFNFPEAQRFVDGHLTLPALLADAAAAGSDLHALYAAFAQQASRAAGRTILCDDTPKHAFYLDAILGGLPEARAVALVRDPRDFLASYKNYWRRSTESARVKAIYHPINSSLLWRSTWAQLSGRSHTGETDRVLLVRYEDLVTDPARTTRTMCDFLGLEYLPELLSVDSSNSSFGGQGEGIFTTSVGRWRQALTPAEAWWCQQLTREAMADLGYATEPLRAGSLARLAVLLTSPIAMAGGLWANRAKRGPLVPYLLRRMKGLLRRA